MNWTDSFKLLDLVYRLAWLVRFFNQYYLEPILTRHSLANLQELNGSRELKLDNAFGIR